MSLRSLSVRVLPGVGPQKERALEALGIRTIDDLLHTYPFRYDERADKPFPEWRDGDRVTARAVVEGPVQVRWRGSKSIMTARVRVDGQYPVVCLWFSQHYLRSKLTDGRLIVVTGKWNEALRRLVVSETSFGGAQAPAWVPVYRASKDLSSRAIHQLILKALEQYADDIPESLPYALVRKYRLWTHREALFGIHRPTSPEDVRQARRRLVFEEFLLFQIQLQWLRSKREEPAGRAQPVPRDALTRFEALLPSPMTNAQRQACEDILRDLERPVPMARLIQGDVGSGKTWVALFACFAVHLARGQSALMAPTEILAEQHARLARQLLEQAGVRVELLTGSVTGRERDRVLQGLASGDVSLAVGTHALLSEGVEFRDLALLVTDEQHRFGVAQRARLREKGRAPDVLMLSATPIPRTLALAIYGDMDVSVLNELPKGRKPIQTLAVRSSEDEAVFRLIRRELARGRQAYVVAPAIEAGDRDDVASATELYERVREHLAGFRVELLHGRMSSAEKERMMRAFRDGDIHALVATTVIEVGIDVPNATVMAIYGAERFGLAQLHQLRGRVGRGPHPSYCLLIHDASSEAARARIETMLQTNDGFEIAERDLELRGPGELFGLKQSGLPEFALGDLARDYRIMEVAREEALALVRRDDFWYAPWAMELRNALKEAMDKVSYRD
ncbi:ATP-dependent DNA helicase RecG [Alicyclobacillus sendaiensis]|uniref:ATP-dependent DNA helicase RecG n=1 Tax=Alicyclobacillus sendaiensis PA2 TaxID=3029425 RepID=A0ABT6XXZ7_ALISE|nr:ATP-dependent DNA helicase RecG [Alicyclobacillus sendaiensis]MDI9259961.1 ATP-dependent DNA helicase RecG [Alicyclobacillus sendaiensis PA2]